MAPTIVSKDFRIRVEEVSVGLFADVGENSSCYYYHHDYHYYHDYHDYS